MPTVEQAVERYFEDATARHLAETTIRKRRELLEGKLLPFCKAKGFISSSSLTSTHFERFAMGGRTPRSPRSSGWSTSAGSCDSARTPAGSTRIPQWCSRRRR